MMHIPKPHYMRAKDGSYGRVTSIALEVETLLVPFVDPQEPGVFYHCRYKTNLPMSGTSPTWIVKPFGWTEDRFRREDPDTGWILATTREAVARTFYLSVAATLLPTYTLMPPASLAQLIGYLDANGWRHHGAHALPTSDGDEVFEMWSTAASTTTTDALLAEVKKAWPSEPVVLFGQKDKEVNCLILDMIAAHEGRPPEEVRERILAFKVDPS